MLMKRDNDYVCQRFGQETVIIMGHSYGTLLGSRYVQMHPEKVRHYVRISQVISIKLGEKAGYEDAYRIAVEKGKNTAKLTAAYEKQWKSLILTIWVNFV